MDEQHGTKLDRQSTGRVEAGSGDQAGQAEYRQGAGREQAENSEVIN